MRSLRIFLFSFLVTGVAAATLSGCGSDGCEELAEICALCPETAEGLIARDSCDRTVDSGDDESCGARIDDETYGPFGCQ